MTPDALQEIDADLRRVPMRNGVAKNSTTTYGNNAAMRKALECCLNYAIMQGNTLLVATIKRALSKPARNCDRFDGDKDKIIEACLSERGLNPDENFSNVFCEWILQEYKRRND